MGFDNAYQPVALGVWGAEDIAAVCISQRRNGLPDLIVEEFVDALCSEHHRLVRVGASVSQAQILSA